MSLERSLRISVLALAGSGVAAAGLALGSTAWLLAALGGFAAHLVLAALRPAWHLRRGLATLAILVAAQGFGIEVLGTGGFFVPAAHFFLLVQLVLLNQERTARTYGLMCIVSFIHIMLAGVLSVDLFFGVCFLVYLPAGVSALLLLNLSCELERNGLRGKAGVPPARLRKRLAGAIGVVAGVELALTIAVFLYFPRFGIQLFQLQPAQRGPTLTGFSDRIQFGDLGRILENAEPVMSVRLLQDGQPVEGAGLPLRWRATAHDTYENAGWSSLDYIRDAAYQPLHPERGFRPFVLPCPGTEVTQEVTLEPVGTRMLFYLPHLLVLKTATPNLDAVFWHQGSRTASSPRGSSVNLRYIAVSRVPAWGAEKLRQPRKGWKPRHAEVLRSLQLPPSITPRVRALAEEVTAGMPPEAFYDRARAVEAHLRGRYDYSLDTWPTRADVDPVEDFLFEHRSGHCEHFASAMAVLLRTLGIPARVATGFSGGDWNEFGQFYVVRQRHAHAWVEAYVPSIRDWVAFDPTPLAEATPPPTGWLARLDGRLAHLRLVWNSYVVNYSSQEQRDMMRGATELLSWLSESLPAWGSALFSLEGGGGGGLGGAVALGVLAVLVAGAALLARRLLRGRRGGRARRGAVGCPSVGFYRRMEAILRRRGFRREPAATPLEFVRAVIAKGGAAYEPAAAIADAFCRVRYGGWRLSEAEHSSVLRALALLERARRSDRGGG